MRIRRFRRRIFGKCSKVTATCKTGSFRKCWLTARTCRRSPSHFAGSKSRAGRTNQQHAQVFITAKKAQPKERIEVNTCIYTDRRPSSARDCVDSRNSSLTLHNKMLGRDQRQTQQDVGKESKTEGEAKSTASEEPCLTPHPTMGRYARLYLKP